MHIKRRQIESMDKVQRLNLINSISGFKSANLIGTIDKEGRNNLAIFSSVIHLGSNPALLGFIVRPTSVPRHTYDNLKLTGHYTINHVGMGFIENAHYTSAKFEVGESEFIECGLQSEFLGECAAPYVRESQAKLGMKFEEEIDISANGTKLIIGSIQDIHLADGLVLEDGQVDLQAAQVVCISGLNSYHRVEPPTRFPYARKAEMPDLKRKKQRPDSVVYDEETDKYNAALLPYATSVSGPSFKADDLTLWKNNAAGKISAHFKTRFEEIKSEYQSMLDQFSWNEIVYTAKFSFEPIVGETYHLYERENGERFLSMIPPDSWDRKHLGTFELNTDRMWMKC